MKMTFACVYITTFPVQAVVRLEPELRERAVIIVEPEPPPSRVFALNEAARRAGAECGMSQVEAAGFKGVEVRRRSQAAEASAHAALLDLARSFSPRFENVAMDTVVLDLAGLEALLGTAEAIAQQFVERARKLGLDANVALAPNPDAARLAARGWAGITLIGEGEEARRLSDLPVEVLDPPLEMQETLERWGIRTFGALAALPSAELSERLGQEGIRLQRLARGGALRALVPAEEPLHFEEAMDLDYPVAEIEPLAFILGRLLNQLCARLAARGRATQELRLVLGLEGGHEDSQVKDRNPKSEIRNSTIEGDPRVTIFEFRFSPPESRALRLPIPTQDSRLLLKLWLLELEAHPPSAPVLKVAITAEPTWPRVAQGDLFLPRAPDPQKLELTLARLRGVVGEDKTGSPELLDTHRPDAFRMRQFGMLSAEPAKSRRSKVEGQKSKVHSRQLTVDSRKSKVRAKFVFDSHDSTFNSRTPNPESRTPVLLRLFRPPLAVSVEVQAGHLVRVDSTQVHGRVVSIAGPWRTSGAWWTDDSWEHDEWDAEIAVVSRRLSVVSYSQHLRKVEGRKLKVERVYCYRLYRDLTNGHWFVGGVYD
ncbi:MAG TPA: DNA polymerase Y family protein [Terriglobia bacterium]|nr:DNA polymerase Y family protein [Terriglobia bacterium]